MRQRLPTMEALGADVDLVSAYVQAQPDFSALRWEHGTDPTTFVVGFSGNIEAHRRDVAGLVANPEGFVICHMPHSKSEVDAVVADLQAQMMDGTLRPLSLGASMGTVEVAFTADQQAAAEELIARYGDLVEVTLGLHPYPPDPSRAPLGPPGPCGPSDLTIPADQAAVTVDLHLDATAIPPGADLAGTVTVRNDGTERLEFATGQTLVATVLAAGTDTVVGAFAGGINDVGASPSPAPGESISLDVIGGTASCDPAISYALPAGTYDVIVAVQRLGDPAANPRVDPPAFISGRVPLTLR